GNTPASVVIQGFGSVGAGCALKLQQLGYQIVGISDANLLITCQDGLDVETLIKYKNEHGEMDQQSFRSDYEVWSNKECVNMDCDILIPAAIEDAINENNVENIKSKL